ncbi:MAG: hypothetical protein J6B90_03895 [Lachnospiraceae bacterium]|nr:hypothetical protein [Lachnospiraceae bacterium]
MKKRYIIGSLIIVTLLIIGISVWIILKGNIGGVYFPPIEVSKVSGVISTYYLGTDAYQYYLYYDGRVYTAREFSAVENGGFGNLVKEENHIGTVYGNYGYYWSVEEEMLDKVTTEGQLYALEGYDDTFRVAVLYKQEVMNADRMIVFECANDMWLKDGEDFYLDRLHLEQPVEIRIKSSENMEQTVQLNAKLANEFMTALYLGEVLENTKELEEEIARIEEKGIYYFITIVRDDGIEEQIMLYPNGYAVYRRWPQTKIFVNMSKEVAQETIEAVNGEK